MLAQRPDSDMESLGGTQGSLGLRLRLREGLRKADWAGLGVLALVTLAVTGAFLAVDALSDAPRKIERLLLIAAAFWTSIITAAWASGRRTLLRELALVVASASFGAAFWFLVALYQIGVTASEMHMLIGLGALCITWSGKGKVASSLAVLWIAFSIGAAVHPIDWGAVMIERPMLLRGALLTALCFAAGWSLGGMPTLAAAFITLAVLLHNSVGPLIVWLLAPENVVEFRNSIIRVDSEGMFGGLTIRVLVVPLVIIFWSLFAHFKPSSLTFRLARAWAIAMLGSLLVDGVGLNWSISNGSLVINHVILACALTLLASSAWRLSPPDILFPIAASLAAFAAFFLEEGSARDTQVVCGVVLTGWAMIKGWRLTDWPLLAVAGALAGAWIAEGIMYFDPVDYMMDRYYREIILAIFLLVPVMAAALPIARWIALFRQRGRHASRT